MADGQGVVITPYVGQTRLSYITPGYYTKNSVPPGKRDIALKTPAIAGVGGFVIHATFQPDRTYYFHFSLSSGLGQDMTVVVGSRIRLLAPQEVPAYFAKLKDQATAPQ